MPFTILSDTDVKSLLSSLTPADISTIATTFTQSLVNYSTQNEATHQPPRSIVRRGPQTSLFMPATTTQHIGVKIVGIAPAAQPTPDTPPQPGLQATLTLCDATGKPSGILNAAEITAFRTALGSMLLFRHRTRVSNILVFGAGAQARWHIRLALLLRGKDVARITVVNRSGARTRELLAALAGVVPPHVVLGALGEGESLEDAVVGADVVFCGVPSTAPVFPARFLTSERARAKARYVAAIGSYRLDMQEVDPELLRCIADAEGVFREQVWRGKVVVDSVEGCVAEAGELSMAGIGEGGMLEVGRIPGLRAGGSKELEEWLEDGFVVYKSVGVGIMDIAIGSTLLELAREKGVGVHLDDF